MELPKHLDTPSIDVDVHPNYVRVVVKEKVTQLRLDDEVLPDSCKVQRSKTTGALLIKMPLQNPSRRTLTEKEEEEELQPLKPDMMNAPTRKQQEEKEHRFVVAGLGLAGSVSLDIVR